MRVHKLYSLARKLLTYLLTEQNGRLKCCSVQVADGETTHLARPPAVPTALISRIRASIELVYVRAVDHELI